MAYNPEEYNAGQPTARSVKKKKTANQFYQLGRASAALDQKQKDAEQASKMSLVQQLLLQNRQMEMRDMMSELKRMQEQAISSIPPPPSPMMLSQPPVGMGPQLSEPPMAMGPPPGLGPMGMGAPPAADNYAPPMF